MKKVYLVTRKVAPKNYLKDSYVGPINVDWVLVSAHSPGKAKSIAQRNTRACDEDYVYLRCRVMDKDRDSWIKGLTPDPNGIILESELDWYERQIEYDYSSHYG